MIHYTDFITANPKWRLAGIYADEGISGTSTRRRDQFNTLMRDCEKGLIDMIVTKSISRWVRNTVDSLMSIRHLRDLGIPVLFEKEGIDTMDSKGEVLITIMSSIAQQESDSISKNVRMGIQYRMQQGKGRLNTSQSLGLSKDPATGTFVIVPGEADLVRRIYREYLDGYSPGLIAARLMEEGIESPSGGKTWHSSTVASILKNEKYCGDLLMQKYYVTDFLTHKVARNTGQLPQYFVEGNHEPIVPKEVWQQVQGEMLRRSTLKHEPAKIRFGSQKALQGRLICGICGRTLKRCELGSPAHIEWQCRDRTLHLTGSQGPPGTDCPCRGVSEEEAQHAVIEGFNRAFEMRDELNQRLRRKQRIEMPAIDARLHAANERLQELEVQIEGIVGEDGNAEVMKGLQEDIRRLQSECGKLELQRAITSNCAMRIRSFLELADAAKGNMHVAPTCHEPSCSDYEEFFDRTRYTSGTDTFNEEHGIVTFSDELVSRYLEQVIVRNEVFDIRFKCGATVHVEKGLSQG